MTSLILDTCAAIWLAEDAEIATVAVEAIERGPYPDVEYPSRRAYLFARKPAAPL